MLSLLLPLLLYVQTAPGADAVERHFNFTLIARQVMEYGQNCVDPSGGMHCEPNFRAYVRNGVLYYHNSSGNTGDPGIELRVPDEDIKNVLVVDGSYRTVPTINGQIPGPAIEVDEGDVVVVNFYNHLVNEASSLHFHGMYQRGTPWMDGVSSMTQCAVLPRQSFTYRFVAEPAGTHFWHSHHGVQRPEGLLGPLIVRPKPIIPEIGRHMRPVLSNKIQRPVCKKEHTMILSMYQHQDSASLFKQRDVGWFPNGPQGAQFVWGRDVSGKLASEIPMRAGLINGRGRALGDDINTGVNLTVYDVAPDEVHCFRVIAGQEGESLRLSVDQHELVAFASDGHDFDPVNVQSIILNAGETFDFAVKTVASAGNFWIRAQTLEVAYNHSALAILRYAGAPQVDALSTSRSCTQSSRCTVLNCPFPAYPPSSFTDCLQMDQLRNADPNDVVPTDDVVEHFFKFAFEPAINNRRFVDPSAPPLTQPEDADMVPCPDDCDTRVFPQQPCECTHFKSIPFNKTVQIVAMNLGIGAFGLHPLHLHGHSFHLLKIGYPPHYNDTGAVCRWPAGTPHPSCMQSEDIESGKGTDFATARWKNDTVPSLNFDRAIRKDTVIIPPGGYVVLRFRTDNPGWWHLHCHMAHHLMSGLGMFINEAPELQGRFPPPPGFPTCKSMKDSKQLATAALDSRGRWEELTGTRPSALKYV
jgi:FtsP/CotA-like multicopper oxidase with cupredoxin domain